MVLTHLKNMKVNGKDDIPYILENKIHVWNHQPDYIRIALMEFPTSMVNPLTIYSPYACWKCHGKNLGTLAGLWWLCRQDTLGSMYADSGSKEYLDWPWHRAPENDHEGGPGVVFLSLYPLVISHQHWKYQRLPQKEANAITIVEHLRCYAITLYWKWPI